MGVYIKGMEMPESCWGCKFAKHDPFQTCCTVTGWCYMAVDERPSDCPLVEVPPHGRLIDADALMEQHRAAEGLPKHEGILVGTNRFMQRFVNAPTIIPADSEAAMEVKQNG